ncbi:MAG: hypothetical protein H6670_04850 [Anaerolineaceae bacterium]|nr:hypothetical protein [Anaerolineaceae bacterium]
MMEDNSFQMGDGSSQHHSQPGHRSTDHRLGGYTGCPMWTTLLPSADEMLARRAHRRHDGCDNSRLLCNLAQNSVFDIRLAAVRQHP